MKKAAPNPNPPGQVYMVIVDGYKFSKDFVSAVHAVGYSCLHVSSTASPIAVMQLASTYSPEDYAAHYNFDGKTKRLLKWIDQYHVVAVIPATESGVMLADQLAVHCNCPNNGLQRSAARRDKYLMLDAIQKSGISVPWFVKISDVDSLSSWIQQKKSYPIVIKPVAQAAGYGLHIVSNEQQLRTVIEELSHKKGVLTPDSVEILAEEYLLGEEYVINTVSQEGKHVVTDYWFYQKTYTTSGYCLYDRTVILPKTFKNATILADYVFKVLDALDIRFGVAHTEVMLTTNGPRLIEVNARVSGIHDKNLWQRCLGYDQIDLCVESYLKSTMDFKKIEKQKDLNAHAMVITLQNEKSGRIVGLPDSAIIQSRPSYYKHRLYYSLGDTIKPTTNTIDAPGRITLLHSAPKIIENDYGFLKQYCEQHINVEVNE